MRHRSPRSPRSNRRNRSRSLVHRVPTIQPLENRCVLAASLGWDGPGLGSAELTYHIENAPSSLSQADTTAAIEAALAIWESAADLTFTPTDQAGQRDSIDLSFTNIDGPGGTLAQAYFPDDVNPARIAGDVQFDASEAWEVGNTLGSAAYDLVWVAVHEIGHALGLDHSDAESGSVLAPFVSPNQAFTNLSAADVTAIQELYAPPVELTPVPDIEPMPEDSPTADDLPTSADTPTDSVDFNEHFSPQERWYRNVHWRRFGDWMDTHISVTFYTRGESDATDADPESTVELNYRHHLQWVDAVFAQFSHRSFTRYY
ncbi:matrixin family metalloprotease [Aureliella helgolandensis]|uniref:Matrixin n=1 Tax=Aureliella helgolandensis TaxID=2527968 RepID=A0A518G408_9BACT|nr:matrixin family metalloprotease [Aureliella helgolandensis]QDV23336.1 Matrixin [Aureliella helgolandensis]